MKASYCEKGTQKPSGTRVAGGRADERAQIGGLDTTVAAVAGFQGGQRFQRGHRQVRLGQLARGLLGRRDVGTTSGRAIGCTR